MIDPQYFADNDWKSFQEKNHPLHPSADRLYQRRQRDSDGNTLFFWNVWHYPSGRHANLSLPESWELDVQFNTHGDGPVWNIETSVSTPIELEEAMGRIKMFWDVGEWEPYDSE